MSFLYFFSGYNLVPKRFRLPCPLYLPFFRAIRYVAAPNFLFLRITFNMPNRTLKNEHRRKLGFILAGVPLLSHALFITEKTEVCSSGIKPRDWWSIRSSMNVPRIIFSTQSRNPYRRYSVTEKKSAKNISESWREKQQSGFEELGNAIFRILMGRKFTLGSRQRNVIFSTWKKSGKSQYSFYISHAPHSSL